MSSGLHTVPTPSIRAHPNMQEALYDAEHERLGRRIAALRIRIDTLTNPCLRRAPRG